MKPLIFLATNVDSHVGAGCDQDNPYSLSMIFEEGLVRAGARVFNPLRYVCAYEFACDPKLQPSNAYWLGLSLDLLVGCDVYFSLHLPGHAGSEWLRELRERADLLDLATPSLTTTFEFVYQYGAADYVSQVEFIDESLASHRRQALGGAK